jgi:2-C-methyl-D-erythritol 2,4-cyclodiphosphate synthase
MRIGIGYDSHRFTTDRPMILGGVHIPDSPGLSGHSDADAVAHAVTDAILGAAALGDIGTHFPANDPRWKDADSISLLRSAVNVLAEHNYQIVNVDVCVVCESPRIGPHAAGMREALAGALEIGSQHVSVKGKTNEGMGWIGRAEGVAVIAVALVSTVDG